MVSLAHDPSFFWGPTLYRTPYLSATPKNDRYHQGYPEGVQRDILSVSFLPHPLLDASTSDRHFGQGDGAWGAESAVNPISGVSTPTKKTNKTPGGPFPCPSRPPAGPTDPTIGA